MNKILLTGNIVRDIELRYSENKIAIVQNTIAVKNEYKNQDGEYDSQFIDFTAFKNNAEYLNKYAKKGCKILIEGKIANNNYQKQDGTQVKSYKIIAEKIELLTFKSKDSQTSVLADDITPDLPF